MAARHRWGLLVVADNRPGGGARVLACPRGAPRAAASPPRCPARCGLLCPLGPCWPVFIRGMSVGPGHSQDVLREMFLETPVARVRAMAIPVAIGVAWLGRRWRDLDARFVAATLVAIPLAVYASQRGSHVNGGYYVGLATPVLLFAAAVGAAKAVSALGSLVAGAGGSRGRSWAAIALRGALVLALAQSTLGRIWACGHRGRSRPDAREGGPRRLTSNPHELADLCALARLRARPRSGRARAGHSRPELSTLAKRVRLLDEATCAPADGAEGPESDFYLAYLRESTELELRTCHARYGDACVPFAASAWGRPHGESASMFRCTGAAAPSPDGSARPTPAGR